MTPLLPPNVGPTGPASITTANPGQMADSMSQIREAVHILEMNLPKLPTGSEEHKAVLKAISDLSKVAPASAAIPGVQMTTLQAMQKHAAESQPLQTLMRNMSGGGGQPMGAGPPQMQMPALMGAQ